MKSISGPGLVLDLPLHRLDGASFMSLDTFGHLCVSSGALWSLQGRTFDGVDDYLVCNDAPEFDITGNLTLEAWIKADMGVDVNDIGGIIYKDEASSERGYYLQYNRGYAQCRVAKDNTSGTSLLDDSVLLNDNRFHHIVTTYRGISDGASVLKLYVDAGEVKSSEEAVYPLQVNDKPLYIGVHKPTVSHFQGIIRELRIYNRALTSQEIQRNYLAGGWECR